MREEYLHYLWHFGLLSLVDLRTTQGEQVQVKRRGEWNFRSGPDFLSACLVLGEMEWTGAVEMHLSSSDWYQHGHQFDTAYDLVVLHVVAKSEQKVYRTDGSEIPTVEIPREVLQKHAESFEIWQKKKGTRPCSAQWNYLPEYEIRQWLRQNIQRKANEEWLRVVRLIDSSQGDVVRARQQWQSSIFGVPVNRVPMAFLSSMIPWATLTRMKPCWEEFAEMILYLGGWNSQTKPYLVKLLHLERTANLPWRTGRLRPTSFPRTRLIQWGYWMYSFEVIGGLDIERIRDAKFWASLDLVRPPGMGVRRVWYFHLQTFEIVKSAVIRGDVREETIERLIQTWEELPPENNSVVLSFEHPIAAFQSAADSHAIMYASKQLCAFKKCLNCRLGNFIMNRKEYD